MLPQLVRRLVSSSSVQLSRCDFRSGEGVQLSGWDGIVVAAEPTAFVPSGTSAWEVSVAKGADSKAGKDLEKRSSKPLEIDPCETTFVYVTARRWNGKNAWAESRRKEGRWRDVRAYDADDLEHWLESALPVHMWFSRLVGLPVDGADDALTFWEAYIASTQPELSADLALAGRTGVVEKIGQCLIERDEPLVLCADSSEEACVVLAAALQQLCVATLDAPSERVVFVHDSDAWRAAASTSGPLVLVAACDLDRAAIGSALKAGHKVVLPVGRDDEARGQAIEIPRLAETELVKALTGMGVPEDRVASLAAVARRGLMPLIEEMMIVRRARRPRWADPERIRSVIPALLVGQWTDNADGDRKAIEALAGLDYQTVRAELIRWSNDEDPPVRCRVNKWELISAERIWRLAASSLAEEDLERFYDVVTDVLGPADPKFDLERDRRWLAGIEGKRLPHSERLRTGLATTLAILGAHGHGFQIVGGISIGRVSSACVRDVLASTNWQVWASLPLCLLAEAAPDEFLDAVDRGLSGDKPFLARLIDDEESSFTASPSHTGLLFALETVAWSPDFLTRASVALARLARLDPGGTWANRPDRSLRTILLPWYPQTAANLAARLAAIDAVRSSEPSSAWALMRSLLPQMHDHSHETARPQWRDWAGGSGRSVTMRELADCASELISRMLQDVGTDGERWTELVSSTAHLPAAERERIYGRLESLRPSDLTGEARAQLWSGLRAIVARHRSFPDAEWALPLECVDRLAKLLSMFEPTDPLTTYVWLFSSRPTFTEGRGEDVREYRGAVDQARLDAVEALFRLQGLSWLSQFLKRIERPNELGRAIARASFAEASEDDWLRDPECSNDDPRREFIGGFVLQRFCVAGFDWVRAKLNEFQDTWTPEQRAAFLTNLPFRRSVWDIVESLDDPTVSAYWRTVAAWHVEPDDLETAVRALLAHDRAGAAIDLIGVHVHGGDLCPSLAADALEVYVYGSADGRSDRRVTGSDLADLLSVVAESRTVDEGRAARLEWALLPVLGIGTPGPKLLVRELARDPGFFTEVVAIVFRAEGEKRDESEDVDFERIQRAYDLLKAWRGAPLPGIPDGGAFDAKAVRSWLTSARNLLADVKRESVGMETIGRVLSAVCAGDDGIWPHEGIRDLIEESCCDDLERGLRLGKLNSEGATWKDPAVGGDRERAIAAQFDAWAKGARARWGRTAAMLRRIRDSYSSRAEAEDRDAEEFRHDGLGS